MKSYRIALEKLKKTGRLDGDYRILVLQILFAILEVLVDMYDRIPIGSGSYDEEDSEDD